MSKTPLLFLLTLLSCPLSLDSGFWSAYLPARKFLHELLRKELSANPATLYFTGHSLGGALTTLAAYDISVHTIPRINQYLRAKKRFSFMHLSLSHIRLPHARKWMARAHQNGRHPHHHSENVPKSHIQVGMYSFGAPRVGNHNLARDYNIFVPNSFRVGQSPVLLLHFLSSSYPLSLAHCSCQLSMATLSLVCPPLVTNTLELTSLWILKAKEVLLLIQVLLRNI
jgi:hypothetical protein